MSHDGGVSFPLLQTSNKSAHFIINSNYNFENLIRDTDTLSNKSGVLFMDRVRYKLLLRCKVWCWGKNYGNEGCSHSGALRRPDGLGRTGYRIRALRKASLGGNDHGHRFPNYSGGDFQQIPLGCQASTLYSILISRNFSEDLIFN